MLPLKIAADLEGLAMPLPHALPWAAQHGFAAVEFDARGEVLPADLSQTGLRELRKMLEDSRLRVVAVRFLPRRGFHSADALDARVDAARRAIQLTRRLGAAILVTTLAPVPDDPADPARRLLLEVVTDLAAYATRTGVYLAAETGQQSAQGLAQLLAALPEAAVGVALNPGLLVAHGFSVEEAVNLLSRRTLHAYLADATSGTAYGPGQGVVLGKGSVEWAAVLAGLEERDYRGHLTLAVPPGEGTPAQRTLSGLEFLARL